MTKTLTEAIQNARERQDKSAQQSAEEDFYTMGLNRGYRGSA